MTTATTTQQSTVTDLLIKFVNQRPGLEFANYGNVSLYRSEMREITKDRQDFYELLGLASRRVDNLNEKIEKFLSNTSGRLTYDGKQLKYCTGQYFPTEYRPAACRVLRDIIWADYRDEMQPNTPNPVYNDGNEIRKAIRRNLSRRVGKNYFN